VNVFIWCWALLGPDVGGISALFDSLPEADATEGKNFTLMLSLSHLVFHATCTQYKCTVKFKFLFLLLNFLLFFAFCFNSLLWKN
jgi:hypothetical protein